MAQELGRLVEFAATGPLGPALLSSEQVRIVKDLGEGRFETLVGGGNLSGEDFDDLLEQLWDLLAPLRQPGAFKPEVSVLRVVQYVGPSDETPGLSISAEWVQFLASVNGFLDIDQYVISEVQESNG